MRPLRQLLSGLCLALVCSQLSYAQVVAEEVAAANWVVGDTYTIDVTRAGVTEQFSGELVQADKQWVSLMSTLPARTIGVPSKPGSRFVKLVSRKNVRIGRVEHVDILPADALQIINHQPRDDKVSEEQVSELPNVGNMVAIRYAARGKLARARGKLTSVSADQLAVTEKNFVGKTSRIPVLGELPFVGGMFTRTVFSMQTNELMIPVAEVLSIQLDGARRFEIPHAETAPE